MNYGGIKSSNVMQKEKVVIEDYPANSVVSVCEHSDFSHLEGKLLTLIEAVAVDSIQRTATKSLVRGLLWEWAYKLPLHERALIGKDLNRLGRVI